MTLMLPVEVRIVPTFEVVAGFGMLNSYSGPDLSSYRFGHGNIPLPPVFSDNPRRNGRGRPCGRGTPHAVFHGTFVVPMSRTNVAALFVILFIYGWNQYLWPLLITTDPEMNTIVMGTQADASFRR